jgi:hypothetical protein
VICSSESGFGLANQSEHNEVELIVLLTHSGKTHKRLQHPSAFSVANVQTDMNTIYLSLFVALTALILSWLAQTHTPHFGQLAGYPAHYQ